MIMRTVLPLTVMVISLGIYGITFFSACEPKAEKLQAGVHAPEFRLPDLNGAETGLSDHAGKVRLIHFWADYCPHCRKEFGRLQEMYLRLQDRHFEVIAVNVAQKKDHVRDIVDEYGLSFTVVLDSVKTVSDLYRVRSLPTTFIVDKNENIVKKIDGWMDESTVNSIIEKLLAEAENI